MCSSVTAGKCVWCICGFNKPGYRTSLFSSKVLSWSFVNFDMISITEVKENFLK